MRTVGITLMLATFLVVASIGGAFADDIVMHSGNVTKIDKASGALEIQNTHGKSEKFSVTDKDILASPVWKKRLNVGDGVDVKTSGNKVLTVLRRNLPVTLRPAEAAAPK
jgi:hypothetical protein